MRVLQLIDSLEAGGLERVAVNLANALVDTIDESFLCATREEGDLKETLTNKVKYFFLGKTSTLDFSAIKKLNRFVKAHKINIIHAHGSSFFIATIVKLLNSKTAIIWHEHYGNRDNASILNNVILKICSCFFSGIIVVNENLKQRSKSKLLAKHIYLLENFPVVNSQTKETILKGHPNKRIVCLANLRPDKDHINLLKAFKTVNALHPKWSLHLIGHHQNDSYYKSVKKFIEDAKLESCVFIYGSCYDISFILQQSNIGVLSSKSEGLPLALLEYGMSGLPVVVTNVGDVGLVVSSSKEGLLVDKEQPEAIAEALITYINTPNLRVEAAKNLKHKVLENFSEKNVVAKLLKVYERVLV